MKSDYCLKCCKILDSKYEPIYDDIGYFCSLECHPFGIKLKHSEHLLCCVMCYRPLDPLVCYESLDSKKKEEQLCSICDIILN